MIGGGKAWSKGGHWCWCWSWRAGDSKGLCYLILSYIRVYVAYYVVCVFVPMLCSLVLVDKCYAFSLSTSILCPLLDFISLMQLLWVVVSVECWTCKSYVALSLLACMFECSFLVWMSIVVTIYSDCSFLVKPYFITLIYSAWLYCACFICITSFLHTMIILCCWFSGDTCSYGSRATQILELGVSEFCSIVLNSHIKSRVCFTVLSQNSQKGRL